MLYSALFVNIFELLAERELFLYSINTCSTKICSVTIVLSVLKVRTEDRLSMCSKTLGVGLISVKIVIQPRWILKQNIVFKLCINFVLQTIVRRLQRQTNLNWLHFTLVFDFYTLLLSDKFAVRTSHRRVIKIQNGKSQVPKKWNQQKDWGRKCSILSLDTRITIHLPRNIRAQSGN